jgi:perosamine synthetase
MAESYQILEQRYAEFTGSEYAVSCNSGTSALHLALLALGVGPGDEVLVPDFTMAACAFAVTYTGAKPVFYTDTVLIGPKVKAIMIVHVYGRLAPSWLWDTGLPVIEDACEAQGAVHDSKADLTCYSFFKNKIICAEEGGMVTTNNPDYVKRMNFLKNMAFGPEHDYYHTEVGYNYRMSNAQALLALKSLDEYPENAKKRREIEGWYNEAFPTPSRDAVWFYDTVVPDKKRALEIPMVRDTFKPLSSFPMYGNGPKVDDPRVLLPCFPEMTRIVVDNIIDQLHY